MIRLKDYIYKMECFTGDVRFIKLINCEDVNQAHGFVFEHMDLSDIEHFHLVPYVAELAIDREINVLEVKKDD